MMYGSWNMKRNKQNFLSFMTVFCPFAPLTTRKIKILKNWKKRLKISSFCTSVSKIMIICCTVPEIWCVTDVIIFNFGPFVALLPPNSQPKKSKLKKKKWKKTLEMSSFYTSAPKFTIIYYTILEIWCVTDVIVIFHLGYFLPFYPPNSPKIKF